VQLAHAADDRLARLLVDGDAEGRVLAREAAQRLGHVDFGLLVDRLDRQRDDRLGHVHRGHRHVEAAVGEGVARIALDAEHRDDVARARLVDVLHLVGVHAHQAANLVLLAGAGVGDERVARELALIDAQVGELPVAAVLELEGEGDGGPVDVRLDDHLGLVVVEVDRLVDDLGRVGQEGDDRVEQLLDALVLVGRAHQHRGQLQADGALADSAADEVLGDALLEDGLGQLVAEHRDRVEHLLAGGLGLLEHVLGDGAVDDELAAVALEAPGLHLDEVDDARELVLQADGKLEQHRVVAELLAELLLDAQRVGADAIALVDEGDARDVVAAHLAVDRQRLALNAGDRAEHEHRAVEHAQGALDLDGEVDVSRGVDDVQVVACPLGVRGGAGDGDPALALEIHRVHGGPDAVLALDLVNGVDAVRVEQDPLGQRGLSAVDVRRDADVA